MDEARTKLALEVLTAIGSGTLPRAYFSSDARWWWNGGIDVSIDEFCDLIAGLHPQTINGIAITPGLMMTDGDIVMIEATSFANLVNGGVYNNRYVFLFAFSGNAIRQVREYSDSAHVLATFDLSG